MGQFMKEPEAVESSLYIGWETWVYLYPTGLLPHLIKLTLFYIIVLSTDINFKFIKIE